MSEVSWFRGGKVPPKDEYTVHLIPENPNHTESHDCVCKPTATFDPETGDWICRHRRLPTDRPYQPGMWPAPGDNIEAALQREADRR